MLPRINGHAYLPTTVNQTAFILTLVFPILLTAEDWLTHAHDNRRSSKTNEQLPPPLSLQWTDEPSFPSVNGWPRNVDGNHAHKNFSNVNYDVANRVVALGKVAWFSTSAEHRVYAIDNERS